MRAIRNILLSICFIVPLAAKSQDGAGQDIKDAGDSAKTAVTKTGAATGKVTVKGLKGVRETQRALIKLWQGLPELQGGKA